MPPPRPAPAGAPLPPGTQGIAQALRGNDALTSLTRRIQESSQRLAALQPLLPMPMRPQVLAGPIDDEGWTLLACNQAVSAKLRQMLPALAAHLKAQGFDERPLRVKLFTRGR